MQRVHGAVCVIGGCVSNTVCIKLQLLVFFAPFHPLHFAFIITIIIIIIITTTTTARQLSVLVFFNYIKSYTVSVVPFSECILQQCVYVFT